MAPTISLTAFEAQLGQLVASAQINMVPNLEPDFSISFSGPTDGQLDGSVATAREEWVPLLSSPLDDFLDRADPAKTSELMKSSLMKDRATLFEWMLTPFGELFSETSGGMPSYRYAPRSIEVHNTFQIAHNLSGKTSCGLPLSDVRDTAFDLLDAVGSAWSFRTWRSSFEHFKGIVPKELGKKIQEISSHDENLQEPCARIAAKRTFLSAMLFRYLGGDSHLELSDHLFHYSAEFLAFAGHLHAAAMVQEFISLQRLKDLRTESDAGWDSRLFEDWDAWEYDPEERPITASSPLMALRISQGLRYAIAHEEWRGAFELYQLLRLYNSKGISTEASWRHDLRSALCYIRFLRMGGGDELPTRQREDCLSYMVGRARNGVDFDPDYAHLDSMALDCCNHADSRALREKVRGVEA